MATYDDLLRTCVKYTGSNYYIADAIPNKKSANAHKHYPIPTQERIVALIDTTVFGSAKTGLAIGETGIYWRDLNLETKKTYMSWNEFASVPIVSKGIVTQRIEMGEGSVVELGGSAFKKGEVVRLLSEIQYLARSSFTTSARRDYKKDKGAIEEPVEVSSATGTRGRWFLAVAGQQFGPYDLSTIREMLIKRQINPEEHWAWREGMSNWVRFDQVPSLAALLHDLTLRSQRVPPPLPTSAPTVPVGSQMREEAPQETVHPTTERTSDRFSSQIDLNHAPIDDLMALPGITLPNSRKLVRERDNRGGFGTVEEVGRLLGLQPHETERLKEQAWVTPYKGSRPSARRVVDF